MLSKFLVAASLAAVATAGFTYPQDACKKAGNCERDCSPGSSDGIQYECWGFLNVSGYIHEWVAENEESADVKGKGFAQAYLSWSGNNGATCNLITSDTCVQPATKNADYKNYQQFYVLWNIYAVYQFFNQYSTALSASMGLASAKLGAIVDKVSVPVEHQVPTPAWYNLLATGLFVAGTAMVPIGAIATEGAALGAALAANLAINSIWVARSLTPVGTAAGRFQTAETRFATLANIGSDLADFVETWQKQIAAEFQVMQDDTETFITLTGSGGFSQRVTLSLTHESTALYKELEIFTLAESLTSQGIVIAKSANVNPMTVATATNGEISCPGFGPAGNCYSWYYHNGNTYAFHDTNDDQRDFTDLINWIWDEQIADDMSKIFANEDCSGKGVSISSPDEAAFCAMNTRNCEYAYNRHWDLQEKTEFKNCDNDPHWMKDCGEPSAETSILPLSYLGPLLHKGAYCRST